MPARKKEIRKREKKEEKEIKKRSIKEKMTEVLELPKEIVLNIPKFTMVGNSDLLIENYKGIVEYDEARIRLNTGVGIVKVTGKRMTIREITSEDIMVSGEISSLEFV